MVDTPGLVPPESPAIREQWIDTPVGKVRYFVDPKTGQLIQDRRAGDQVVNFRLANLELGHGQLSKQLEMNTALTQQVVDILQGTKVLVSLIRFLATMSKYVLAIAAGILFAYSVYKGKPDIPSITIFEK